MKKNLLIVTILSWTCYGNAQICDSSLPILENFEDAYEVSLCWDFIDADNDGRYWEVGDLGGGNNGIKSASHIEGVWPFTTDNWIISEGINLTAVGSASLSWKVKARDWNADNEKYTVYVSTGKDISNFLSSSSVSYSEDLNGSGNQWQSRSLNASSLTGQMVYVAVRHHTYDQSEIYFDDLLISGGALGIEDFNKENFKFFYSKDNQTLSVKSVNNPISSIKIYNILGQTVVNKKLSDYTESINLSTLVDAIYIAKVEIDNTVKSIKFLKR
jgi:hypothetical protein